MCPRRLTTTAHRKVTTRISVKVRVDLARALLALGVAIAIVVEAIHGIPFSFPWP
jgi:hypothetical protein